jgi:hypothetical protein
MSVGRPGNGRQPLDEPYTVQWTRWPISCGDQPPTGEPDAKCGLPTYVVLGS